MSNNLLVDEIHLTNSCKFMLDKVNHNALANEKTPSCNCNSFNGSVKHPSNSHEYGPCNKITDAKIGLKEMKNLSTNKLILSHLLSVQ